MNASNSKERTQTMKKAFLILAMTAGLLTSAAGTDESFDDTGWQKGPSDAWFVNWDKAVAESKKSGKPIFVLKTGSDWCGWCIRLRKNVLSKPEFADFAKKNLVLLYLDSPNKNPLGEEQKRHNQQVSRRLSLGGGVPNAAVVTADGRKLGAISGGGLELDAYLQKLGEIIGKQAEVKAEKKTDAVDSAKAETRTPESAPKAGCRLPYDLMPKNGRIADFDFTASVSNKAMRAPALHFTDGQIVDRALWLRGQYVAKVGWVTGDITEIPLPDLNYDHFTVAMSFAPECCNRGAKARLPIFVLCEGWRRMEISVGNMDEIMLGMDFAGAAKTGLKIRRNAWNWLICSVDAVGRRIVIGVNGECFEYALPVDFYWRFPSAKTKDRERNVTIFTHMGMGSATRGFVDDLLVYNRLFCKGDIVDISQGRRLAEIPEAKSLMARTPVWPDTIPQEKWLFRSYDEKSVFWNGQIRSGNWTLDVHRDGETVIVQPYYADGSGKLDLSKPVETADGKSLRIEGIGYPRMWNTCPNPNNATEVILPETLEYVYKQAFSGGSFQNILLPDGVRMIKEGAFSRCTRLREIHIPKSVESIWDRAFQGCTSLVSVDIRGAGVKIASSAFSGGTPVEKKMSGLKSPVGPIEVTVSERDETTAAKRVQIHGQNAAEKARQKAEDVRREAERAEQRRQLLTIQNELEHVRESKKEVPPEVKVFRLKHAAAEEVASEVNRMLKGCMATPDLRCNVVSVTTTPQNQDAVCRYLECLDIRLTEVKLDLKVVRVVDVKSIDSAIAKLTTEPDKAEVAFEQTVIVRENSDALAAGMLTVCEKPTVVRFRCRPKKPHPQGGDFSVEWEIACSNASGVVCALSGAQTVGEHGATPLGGFMAEERSGLFSFFQPAGVNVAYLLQLSAKDLDQVQASQTRMAGSKKTGRGGQGGGLEEKMLDEKSQEGLRRLAAQIRKEKLSAAEKSIKAGEKVPATAFKTNQVQRYSWKYEIRNGAVEIHGVTPPPTGDFEIPETIEGCPVVSVGGMRNGQMSSIKFPSTLKWIGESAFENCRHLKRLEFPGALERIGGWAFAHCERLEAVRVPPSVNRLSGDSFCGSKKIGCFLVDPENPNYRVENGMLLERDAKLVMGFPMMIAGPVRIPDGIVEIGNEAFAYCDRMTNVSIASSVRTIARQAFLCCDGLTDVSVPEGVRSLGSRAFSCCKRLQSLGLPASLIKCEGNPVQSCPSFKTLNLAAGNGVFMLQDGCLITMSGVLVCMANAHEQKELCMPQGIAEIGDGVFWDCNNLEVAVIPEGVVRIGGTAFHGCDRLRELTLPLSLRQIGNLAFQFCPELKSVNVPAGVTNIASQAFAFNRKLEEVTVAGSCTIGTSVFTECPNLSNVRLLGESIRLTAGSMPKELAQGVLQFPQGQRSAIFKGPIALDRMQSNRGR